MDVNIKKRAANWTEHENSCLAELVSENIQIIRAKLTPSMTNDMKNEVWVSITDSFNSSSKVYRATPEIKKKWQEMQSKTKLAAAKEAHSRKQTGGGPAPEGLKPWQVIVRDTLPTVVVMGLEGGVDTAEVPCCSQALPTDSAAVINPLLTETIVDNLVEDTVLENDSSTSQGTSQTSSVRSSSKSQGTSQTSSVRSSSTSQGTSQTSSVRSSSTSQGTSQTSSVRSSSTSQGTSQTSSVRSTGTNVPQTKPADKLKRPREETFEDKLLKCELEKESYRNIKMKLMERQVVALESLAKTLESGPLFSL